MALPKHLPTSKTNIHIRDLQRRGDDPYGVQVNGGTQGSPWQSVSDGNMFPTPVLRAGNQIIIKGQMTEDRRLYLEVRTGSGSVCQINVANRQNEIDNENFLKISSQGEVVHTSEASGWFNNGTQYIFRFEMNGTGLIDIYAGIEEGESDQYLETVAVDVNNLKLISVNGEVEKLIYKFK